MFNSLMVQSWVFITVIIGYYDYLGTRPKNSYRAIIFTGR